MAVSRVIEVSFGRSSVALVRVNTAYFYNSGIIFKPTDIELPTSYQVHWADSPDKATTLEMIGTAEGTPIPDDLWNRSRVIYGWIYLHPTEDSGVTAYEVRIYKNVRAGLPDGTEPTPAEQSTIDQLISAMNSAVEQTGEDVESASQSAQSAESAKTAAESARDTAGEYANDAETSAASASTSASQASASATASAQSASQSAQIKADVEGMVDDAQGYASASAQSASQASASEQGCARAVLDAASAAAIARARAEEASGYAQTASSKAQDASTSAQTASQKATEASQSASQALSYKTDAESAKTASQTAQGLAESARDSAVSAKTDAESAKADAESARDEAQQAVASISGALADKAPVITDTASGAIASFTDGADNIPLKSLIVNIDPVQDTSSGDPSPENICPISGWTQVGVNQFAVNVWDEEWEVGGYAGATGAAWDTNTRIRSKTTNYISVLPNTTYYVNMPSGTSMYLNIIFYNAGKTFISSTNPSAGTTFTTPSDARFMRFASGAAYGTTYNHDISINYPSTDHSYHPYTGRSITIDLGQTVYGGHLDVISGELTVYPYYASYNGETLTGEWISDRDKYVSGTTPTIGAQVVNIGAQGLTVQLEPHEVESLYGVNNLWADSGDTEVEYRADTKLFIERLTAPDSADMIADANIASGQYFMVGDSLYKATANIANGSAIVVGTNCIRKSLSEALNEINA